MTATESTITDLLEKVHKTMTDAALADELGVTGQTVYRWRHERSPVQLPKLVRRHLEEILAKRDGGPSLGK